MDTERKKILIDLAEKRRRRKEWLTEKASAEQEAQLRHARNRVAAEVQAKLKSVPNFFYQPKGTLKPN